MTQVLNSKMGFFLLLALSFQDGLEFIYPFTMYQKIIKFTNISKSKATLKQKLRQKIWEKENSLNLEKNLTLQTKLKILKTNLASILEFRN